MDWIIVDNRIAQKHTFKALNGDRNTLKRKATSLSIIIIIIITVN